MSPTHIKSNYLIALLDCVNSCSDFIKKHASNFEINACLEKAMQCRAACMVCIEACESAELATRGQLMYTCKKVCQSFLDDCISISDSVSLKCAEACKECIIECENLMAE